MNKITTKTIRNKKNKEKIVSITAYDYTFARILDQCEVDIILVGDSLSNVIAGYKTTLPIGLDEMIYHSKSVRRGVERSLLIGDMPFMSYQINNEKAITNAGRFMKEAEVDGIKLEGGEEYAEVINKLTQIGIPVMGHLGFTPQSEHQFGGRYVQGKGEEALEKIIKSAKVLQECGAFSIVLEMVPIETAKQVTESIDIPTIGIGAGPYCDGQIIVCYDLLGMDNSFSPKFLRRYANLNEIITNSVNSYSKDVISGDYPTDSESYH